MADRPELIRASEPLRTQAGWSSLCTDTGRFSLRLLNGVFGDPLMELRVRDSRRRILFDLGDASALSRRVLHRVTDVFITHAHFDHVCGFLSLLRARMTGSFPTCRIYGPPGIQEHVAGFIAGIRWDRIGDAGPEFRIGEVHPDRIRWWRIKVGHELTALGWQRLQGGLVCAGPDYAVRCAQLDHGIPVLCWAVEAASEMHVSKARLHELGLTPGPWLSELKAQVRAGDRSGRITVGVGRREPVERLAQVLLDTTPGERLVYATDFADSPDNRAALETFCRGADLLFCEATFCEMDRQQAEATQHLTTRACSEIAVAAGVRRLVPFHFSKRYTNAVEQVYAEIEASLRG
jgi:ribonuclease BN (tRNA processing enzyme)